MILFQIEKYHIVVLQPVSMDVDLSSLTVGIPSEIPPSKELDPTVDHAPSRRHILNPEEERLALRNALRYFPKSWHHELASEFLRELRNYGRIYMHRIRPTEVPMKAYPIE